MNFADVLTSWTPWQSARGVIKKYWKQFLGFYLYAALVNLPILVLRLTNQYDGMWNQDDYYAGAWELSNGRWFWPFLDLGRFRLSLDPLPDLFSIALFVIAWLVVLSCLDLPGNWITNLAGALFLSGTGITCQLSFSYMSITFGTSALLASLSVWLIVRAEEKSPEYDSGKNSSGSRKILHILIPVFVSSLLIAIMMGCYQASIGITCITALFVFMLLLARYKGKPGRALHFAGRMLCAVILGGILYLVFLHLCYYVFHVGPASYEGFDQLTPSYIIQHLPYGIRHAYSTFFFTMLYNGFRIFRLAGHKWFWALEFLILFGAIILMIRTMKSNLVGGFLFLASLLLIPLFTNSFYLMVPESEAHIQMIVPMNLVLPLLLCLYTEIRTPVKDKAEKQRGLSVLPIALFFVSCFMIYCAASQCIVDQYAMYAGRRSTEAVADNIMDVVNSQNYDYLNGELLFLGTPEESPVFRVGEQYYSANAYAQYGRWSDDLTFNDQLWQKFFLNYKRLNISIVNGDTETTIANLPETAAMPCYPSAGSIAYVYGVEVVKISDAYYVK